MNDEHRAAVFGPPGSSGPWRTTREEAQRDLAEILAGPPDPARALACIHSRGRLAYRVAEVPTNPARHAN